MQRRKLGNPILAGAWCCLALALSPGCGTGGDGSRDAGPDGNTSDGGDWCYNDFDCAAPDICLDHLCQLDPGDPDANRVVGRFTAILNRSTDERNTAVVRGKLDGRSFYMEFVEASLGTTGDVQIEFYSPLSYDTWIALVLTVPRQTPLDTPLYFGPNAVVTGIYMRWAVHEDGGHIYVDDEIPLAYASEGQIDFSSFSTASASVLESSFNFVLTPQPTP